MTSSRGRSVALGDRLAVSLATAKRLPSAKNSLLSPDARTSEAFSDGHMLLSIDSYGIIKTPRSKNPSLDVSSAFLPRRTCCSYPKWVGVGFHLFRGAASSGRETIHSPPSVKEGAETSYRRYCRTAANKFEDQVQPQGPIIEQALRLVLYELKIDGSANQDELQRWLVSLRENPRQYKSIFSFTKGHDGGLCASVGKRSPEYSTRSAFFACCHGVDL